MNYRNQRLKKTYMILKEFKISKKFVKGLKKSRLNI